MNDIELELNNIIQRATQLFQTIQTGAVGPDRVSLSMTTPVSLSHASITSPNHPLNLGGSKIQKRPMPTQYTIPNNLNTYGGAYNSYPYRGMANMNMGAFNPYSAYGQPIQFHNPIVIAAAENSRPAFESIQSVVQSFNSVSMLLESTFTAMQISFQALLGVAENFTRLRTFMMKLYSTIVSFKLARWFLTKLFYLLKMVRGDRGSNTEDDLWTALSSADNNKEMISSDGRSWPLIIFTGLLVTTPYLVYKLLNSVTPESVPSVNNTLPSNMNIDTAQCDLDPKTIPLVKGKSFLTSQENIALAREAGWLLVDNFDRKQGCVPLVAVKARKTKNRSYDALIQDIPNVSSYPEPSNSIHQQKQPKPPTPVTDVHGDPIALPHPLIDCDKSNINNK